MTQILIAEDEPAIRNLLATILRRYRFTVTTASDGADALRQLEAGAQPDVLLLDLMMPNLSGRAVIAELEKRAHPLATRLIVLTAASDQELKDLPPTTRLVRKPFEIDRLLTAIRELAPLVEAAIPAAPLTLLPNAIAEA
jgi:CheY-like chemotaxis protein